MRKVLTEIPKSFTQKIVSQSMETLYSSSLFSNPMIKTFCVTQSLLKVLNFNQNIR